MPSTKRPLEQEEAKKGLKKQKTQAVDADFVPPSDWPKDGPLNLAVDDLPHASADTEWWYINGHVEAADGRKFSYFASFFRIVREVLDNGDVTYVHALNWGIVDCKNQKYLFDPVVDVDAPAFLEKQLENGKYDVDPLIRRAFLEVVRKGKVPLPDRPMKNEAQVKLDRLDIDLDGHLFKKLDNGNYYCKCQCEEKGIALELELKPKKQPTRQGHNGFVKIGVKRDTMMYYFIPRNEATGTLTVDGEQVDVKGTGWYDHEFGGHINADKHVNSMKIDAEEQKMKDEHKNGYAWNWVSLQLDNGLDITATNLIDPKDGHVFDNYVITVEEDSTRTEHPDLELVAQNNYASPRTTLDYPTKWTLKSKQAQLDLQLEAEFDNQEFVTLISKPGFWEGRMNVTGTWKGQAVTGLGFIERHGHQTLDTLENFFGRVSKQVHNVIDELIPRNPTYLQARELICSEKDEHMMDGASVEVFTKNIVDPIREYVSRGDRAWRSHAFMMVVEAVGGDCEKYRAWAAMPEIMHVGTLIVDDLQGNLESRDGKPACHKIFGEEVAINAGTDAYFLALHLIKTRTPGLTKEQELKLYETYFLALRSGHGGQAFEIHGFDYLMNDVVATGNIDKLEQSLMVNLRLKGGVAASSLTTMGAILGGASDELVGKISAYFEAIGTAYLIMDQVMSIRGTGNKNRGRQIKAGKVTYPLAMAMTLLNSDSERRELYDSIKAKPEDEKEIYAIADRLEQIGATAKAVQVASDLIESAWTELDPVLNDSLYKLVIRAFGFWAVAQ